MSFHNCITLKYIDKFPRDHLGRLPRDNNDMLQMWKVIEYFKPKSILEIGFSAGQTFGIFLDAAGDDTKYVAVDKDFARNKKITEEIFCDHPTFNKILMLNIDSKDLNLAEKFDFIHVDGDHSYEMASNDIKKSLEMLTENSLLCIDDTLDVGVEQAIRENLLGQNEFVPFLAGNKQIFFKHVSLCVRDFFDNHLMVGTQHFAYFNPWRYLGYDIYKMHVVDFVEDNFPVFLQAVKNYNI